MAAEPSPTAPSSGAAQPVTPAELVARAQRGDQAAFSELHRRYRPRIYALAMHLTGDAHDADDVAQEAFLRAYRSLGEFRGASEFFTWVYRIAVNLSLNVKRASARRRTTSMDDPRVALAVQVDASGDPRRAAELRETYSRLIVALDRLSPSLRSTVVLVALQGLSHDQAGAVLGCPVGTIAWRLHEARQQLTRALTPPRRVADCDSGLHLLVPIPGR
ncbi:MAG: sigma-70 family RNA polymerase sigma factor [Myxococcales bacterium]|nr:sigma-70 family RNA polymerase sigma factor [Myxococcales bacterium]